MDEVSGETTHENWFQREGKAIKQMCCGFVLVILASGLIFWNETNLVIAQATADVMKGATVVENCVPASGLDSELVFSACNVNAPDIASNLPPVLQSFVPVYEGASLSWSLEIYQWKESSSQSCTKNNDGSKTCHTSYSYSKDWSSSAVSSGGFHSSSGHQNTGSLPSNLQPGSYSAPAYSVFLSSKEGAASADKGSAYFVLDEVLQGQFPSSTAVKVANLNGTQTAWDGSSDLTDANLRPSGGYLTTSIGATSIGDVRISIHGSTAKKASVCAKTAGLGEDGTALRLGPYPPVKFDIWGRKTYDLEYLRGGTYDLSAFIDLIKGENSFLAWLLRLVGFVLMIAAFFMIFSPLSVMADLLMVLNYCTCCLGSILDKATQAVISAVSCASGCCCFMFIFCCAWCVANPTYSVIGLVVIVGICVAGAIFHFKTAKEKGEVEAREICVRTPYVQLGNKGHNVVALV